MAHFDRGVYQPNDEVRVFDGSDDDEDVEGSRLPLLIVLALLVLAMFAGVVWLAYTHGVAQGRTETPVLTAQNGPARIAPQNPGGAEQPYKGFKIYEQPAPPDDEVDNTTAPAASQPVPAPTPTPAAAAPVSAPTPQAAPIIAAPPPKAATLEAAPKPAAPKITALPATVAVKPAPVAKAAPIALKKEVPASTPAAVGGPATGAPRSLALVSAKPVVAAAPASGGATVLQIGAYKSQADADAAWKSYKVKHAALLSGATEDVQQADLGDKGTWYRLRIVGFPSKDVASAMCDRLKADGGGCFLGR